MFQKHLILSMVNMKTLHSHCMMKLLEVYGREVYVKGAYLIADGGFLKIGVFMDPSHQRWGLEEVRWSEFLESVRKDVECFFGILKGRFRILRNGMEYYSEFDIEFIFKTCCILHNIILEYDRGYAKELALWEDATWEVLDNNPNPSY